MTTCGQFNGVMANMLEVKGRTSIVWYWAITGIVVSVLGWWSLGWVDELGKLWFILAISVMISGVIVVGIGIWKALDKRPVLIADRDGVLDRTSLQSRRMAWNEITGFRLVTTGAGVPQWLAIELVDPQRFMDRFGSGPMMKAFQTTYGTPCVISVKAIDIEPHTLLANLKSAQQVHKT